MTNMEEKKYNIVGMHCAACTKRVEDAAKKTEGVINANVSLLTGILSVVGNCDEKTLINNIESCGYTVSKDIITSFEHQHKKEANHILRKLIISTCFLFPLMYISLGQMFTFPLPGGLEWKKILTIVMCLLALSIMIINNKTFINAVKGALKLSFNMDTLVSLGAFASFFVSLAGMVNILMANSLEDANSFSGMIYFDSSAMVLTLVNIGKMLEEVAKSKTTSALDSLNKLRPKTVRLESGELLDISFLKTDMIFIVKAGETIASDGIILNGQGTINESMITGESLPKDVAGGVGVIGGTILLDGFLTIKATAVGEETMLCKIIKEVETASSTKAPIGRIADKVSGYFAVLVLGISLVTFLIWSIISKNISMSAIYASNVLVISCPCALGLATPVAITVGIGRCAKNGILIKNATALEIGAKIKKIYFDKTGTLTLGNISVVKTIGDQTILPQLVSLESKSGHPIAKAITNHFKEVIMEVTDFTILNGGIKGIIDGIECFVGNEGLTNPPEDMTIDAKEQANSIGGSLIFCEYNQRHLAIILADELKANAKEEIGKLKSKGIMCALLTGDSESSSNRIKEKLQLSYEKHSLTPIEKARIIQEAKKTEIVGFVGDGINDAVALESSSVGIAISGTDIAINAADVVIISNEIKKVNEFIDISKTTTRIIKENLFWAFIYNILCIPLAAGVFSALGITINPMIGSMAMSLSSLCVVLNSLRIGISTKQEKKERIRMKKIKIKGMMCSHCVARVVNAFKAKGITAEVSLERGEAIVDNSISDKIIKEIIEEAGYELG